MSDNSDLKWIVGILLTGFVAWWFRNREAKKATHLKDLRSKIDAISNELHAVEELLPDYFLIVGQEMDVHIKGLKIKAKLRRISNAINTIYRITGYSDWIVLGRGKLKSIHSAYPDSTRVYIAHGEKALSTVEKLRGSITSDKADIETKRKEMSANLLTCLKSFRQAITLDNFDAKDRVPLQPTDPKFEKIFKAGSNLKDSLEAIYESEKKL